MRTACLVLLLLLSGLAFADDEVLPVDWAKRLLTEADPARQADGIRALSALGTKEALAALLPHLEDRKLGAQVGAAFRNAKDRPLAAAVMDAALVQPDIPIGHGWMHTRAMLERVAGPYGDLYTDAPFAPPDWPPLAMTQEEQATWLAKVAGALPVKRASALAPSFWLLVTFHYESPHFAPAAARAWLELDEATRAYLLGDEGWPLIRGELMKARLPSTPETMTTRAPGWHVDHARSLALRRLVEMGSADARAEILADMRRPAPRLTRDALLALDDASLPELEATWAKSLEDRAHRDLSKLAPVLERYASKQMLECVLALYRKTPGWACEIQSALLGYILEHDKQTGLEEVRAALARRGEKHTGCYRSVLHPALSKHWSPEAEALALEALGDPERAIRIGAGQALIAAGSLAASDAVLALIASLDGNGPEEGPLRFNLLLPLVEHSAWMDDPGFEQKLRAILTETDFSHLRLSVD